MTFAQSLITEIESSWDEAPIYFNLPANVDKEYVVMATAEAEEQPETFCEEQGEQGNLRLIFAGVSSSPQAVYNLMESCKDYVAALLGPIAHGSPVYVILDNETDGIRIVDAGMNTWQGQFEARMKWRTVAA
jgi:hypothetical protein